TIPAAEGKRKIPSRRREVLSSEVDVDRQSRRCDCPDDKDDDVDVADADDELPSSKRPKKVWMIRCKTTGILYSLTRGMFIFEQGLGTPGCGCFCWFNANPSWTVSVFLPGFGLVFQS